MTIYSETLERANGVLDDICGEIGYTATNSLVDWFGGGNLHIPTTAAPDHAIAKVIGLPAMKRLVTMYEGKLGNQRLLWVPLGYAREIARRDRMIAVLFAQGLGTKHLQAITGMSERHIQSVRAQVEEMGILPMILHRAGLHEMAA